MSPKNFQEEVRIYKIDNKPRLDSIYEFYSTFRHQFTREGLWLAVAGVRPSQVIGKRATVITDDIFAAVQQHVNQKGYIGTEKEDHQRRLPIMLLRQMADIVFNNYPEVIMLNNFQAIHTYIDRLKIKGFAEVAVYDAALRIGFIFNHLPDRIYLHAGVTKGARRLGLNIQRQWMLKHEIEDIFCTIDI